MPSSKQHNNNTPWRNAPYFLLKKWQVLYRHHKTFVVLFFCALLFLVVWVMRYKQPPKKNEEVFQTQRLKGATFFYIDNQNRRYTITAAHAHERSMNTIDFENVVIDIRQDDALNQGSPFHKTQQEQQQKWWRITAHKGVFLNQDAGYITLKDNVRYSTQNQTATTRDAYFDVARGVLSGNASIEGTMPAGDFVCRGFRLDLRKNVWSFKGPCVFLYKQNRKKTTRF